MTAHDVNKKPQALNILFCRRKLQESMFTKKGGFTGERVYAFNYSRFGGFIGEGDNWEGGGGAWRELLRYATKTNISNSYKLHA